MTKSVIAYFLAAMVAYFSFSPWLAIAIPSWSKTGANWTAVPISLIDWLKTWGLHINRTFILTFGNFGFDHLLIYLTLPFLLLLVSYAIYFICHQTPKRVWLFILTLMGTTALALGLPDLILGGQRSTSTQYLVPLLLGIQLSVACLLATQITSLNFSKRKFWQVVMAIVISAGVISCTISSQAETSWNKVISYNNYQIARIVNQSKAPVLISNSFGINLGNILALSYLFDSKVRLQLVNDWTLPDFENIPKISPYFSDVFLLNPSEQFRENLGKEYNGKTKLIYNDNHLWLWKLEKV